MANLSSWGDAVLLGAMGPAIPSDARGVVCCHIPSKCPEPCPIALTTQCLAFASNRSAVRPLVLAPTPSDVALEKGHRLPGNKSGGNVHSGSGREEPVRQLKYVSCAVWGVK